uniref:Uncharacterized protein n=1 Tax=Physcomitrium patens TaxID=3218 RepID=A0A2K1KBR2_PHYPA|nr:hypothetical protein PHYPA_010397 [Physcomitrium patens]
MGTHPADKTSQLRSSNRKFTIYNYSTVSLNISVQKQLVKICHPVCKLTPTQVMLS